MKEVRGYITSRPFFGERVPQNVQNIVIRDFCRNQGLHYLLSATEYAMPGSHLVLDQVLLELPRLHGIVAYSLFQLPIGNSARAQVLDLVLCHSSTLYFAVEGIKVSEYHDIDRLEDIWRARLTVSEKCEGIDTLLIASQ
jgi:sporadic carbohydrate cluster protein (TIGR04323 family)